MAEHRPELIRDSSWYSDEHFLMCPYGLEYSYSRELSQIRLSFEEGKLSHGQVFIPSRSSWILCKTEFAADLPEILATVFSCIVDLGHK